MEDRGRIALDLEVPVVGGRDPASLHPLEAVDVALADPAFRDLVEPVRVGYESEEYVGYDAVRDAWIVGLCGWFDDERVWWKAAAADPVTGALAEILDGPGAVTCEDGLPPPGSPPELTTPVPGGS